jgi:hypothetical protein
VLDVFGGAYNTGIRIGSSSANGAGVSLANSDTGGKTYDIISTGSSNSPGAGLLSFYDESLGYVMSLKGGNLGIGTTSPARKLTINDTSPDLGFYTSGIERVTLRGTAAALFQVDTAGATRMTINASGNVGIGTATPVEKLTVETPKGFYGFTHFATDANGANPIAVSTYVGGSASGATGGWLGTKTNHDLHFFTNGGQPQMTLSTNGNVGIGISTPTNKLHVENTGSGSVAVYGNVTNSGTGVWGNNTNNGTGVYGSSGNGIGILGESNGFGVRGKSINGYAGYFEGKVYVGGSLEVFGNICAANFMCQSDARLKQAVAELHYGLSEVLRLRPVRWDWKDQAQRQLNLGLIAQEVEPVMPELVLHGVDAKDSLGLNYLGLIPVLVKGIQEQQEQINALRKTNDALNARLRLIERTLKNKRGSTRQRR